MGKILAFEPRGGNEVVHGGGVVVAAEDELLGGDHPAAQHVVLLGQRPVEVGLGLIICGMLSMCKNS